MADPVWTTSYCQYDDEGGGQVLVDTLHWSVALEDSGFEASEHGTVNTADQNRVFALPALQNVPESVMTGWVQQALGTEEVDAIEARLVANIEEQKNPTSGGLVPA